MLSLRLKSTQSVPVITTELPVGIGLVYGGLGLQKNWVLGCETSTTHMQNFVLDQFVSRGKYILDKDLAFSFLEQQETSGS